jgi:hypothetical protein
MKPPRHRTTKSIQPVEATTIDNLDDGNDVSVSMTCVDMETNELILTTNLENRLRNYTLIH